MNYSQPDFYKFSETSVLLAKFAEKIKTKKKRFLDAFCGCGVVGIEYSLLKGYQNTLFFNEIQKDFLEHLNHNRKKYLKNESHIIKGSFFEIENKFDLIICNPPYFEEKGSRASQNLQRNICHRQIGFNYSNLLKKSESLLEDKGDLVFSAPSLFEMSKVQSCLKLKTVKRIHNNKEAIFHFQKLEHTKR